MVTAIQKLAALALLLLLVACGLGDVLSKPGIQVASGQGLNVLLISIDTLRADHLGCYGYDRPTSPNLDAFAAEGVRFSQAITQAPWTTPSHMTLLTSLYPSIHGLTKSFVEMYQSDPSGLPLFPALSPEVLTLAETLQRNGYETLALTGGGTMSASFGFDQGFSEFLSGSRKLSNDVWTQLERWLDRDRTRPFFLFFHSFEVHAPYLHDDLAGDLLSPEQSRAMAEAMDEATTEAVGRDSEIQQAFLAANGLLDAKVTSALYDGGIRAIDSFLGRLFEELRRRELYDRTLIVVLSDHGEAFGEHDPERIFDAHCDTQYEELLHVPLMVRFPPLVNKSRVVERPVGLIDVAPTILDLLDIPVPETWQGRSLESLLVRDWDDLPWTVSEATCTGPSISAWREDRFKYIASFAVGPNGERSFLPGPLLTEELYDLVEDPAEKRNLANVQPDLLAAKRAILRGHFERLLRHSMAAQNPRLVIPDPRLKQDLKALGYL